MLSRLSKYHRARIYIDRDALDKYLIALSRALPGCISKKKNPMQRA